MRRLRTAAVLSRLCLRAPVRMGGFISAHLPGPENPQITMRGSIS